MNSISDEIYQLQSRVIELEQQEKEQEKNEINKQTSFEHNINVLHDIVTEKKLVIEKKVIKHEQLQITCYGHNTAGFNYQIDRENHLFYNTPSNIHGVYHDQQTLKPLEAIYHILQIINNRLNKLENQ
jgi:hypothetical protein